MKYNAIVLEDIANGDGVGVSLYVQGCPHHCSGCFNPETWDYNLGREFTLQEEEEIFRCLDKPYISHFSILGGEPLESHNIYALSRLINKIKRSYPHIKIWIWTGYTWRFLQNEICRAKNAKYLEYILKNTDYLIDGPFIQEEKDLTLKWRGSRNQRIIKSAESMRANRLILDKM